MRVLIAGGTGLIGNALGRLLLAKNASVVTLTRTSTPKNPINGVKYVVWGGQERDWMEELNEVDAVVNLAGESLGSARWTAAKRHRNLQSRLDAGANLVEAIQHAIRKPLLFMQSSAIGFYGTDLVESFDESSPNGRDYLAGIAQTWEDSTLPVEGMGIIRSIIRTGIVLDRREGALARMLLPFKLFVGGPLGSGRQWMSWIHLADEVGAIYHILSNRLSGVFNLTAPHPVRNREMGMTIAETLSRPYWMPVPGFALKALFGEMSTLVLDGQKVIPNRLMETGYEFQFPQLSSALGDVLGADKG